jgi:hypothetical protein
MTHIWLLFNMYDCPCLQLFLLNTVTLCVHVFSRYMVQPAIVLALPRPPESYTDLACMQVRRNTVINYFFCTM